MDDADSTWAEQVLFGLCQLGSDFGGLIKD
jgi:hypothetical protein